MTAVQGLITSRVRALLAVVITAWFFANRLHPVTWGKPVPWTWMYAGFLPPWAVVVINAMFNGFWLWLGVVIALAPIRKEEKAIWLAYIVSGELTPVRVLIPKIRGIVQLGQTGLSLIAFLAAMALLVSFWDNGESEKVR
jgi:hypothetical protein